MTATTIDNGFAWRPVLVGAALLSLIAGVAYPLGTTLLGSMLFPDAARGSLVERDGRVVGSTLMGQAFASERYFIGRPSAAGYAGRALAGSNLAPSNPALRERIEADVAAVAAREGVEPATVPVDLVTASGSGSDPHISPESALLQVSRVARARGLDPAIVRAEVERHVEPPTLGLLGKARVNVLLLNLALDARPSR